MKKRIKIIVKKYKQRIVTSVVACVLMLVLCGSVVFASEPQISPLNMVVSKRADLKVIEPASNVDSAGIFITPYIDPILFDADWTIEECYITSKTLSDNRCYIDDEGVLWTKEWSDFGLSGEAWSLDEVDDVRLAEDVVHFDIPDGNYNILWLTSDGKLYGIGNNYNNVLDGDYPTKEEIVTSPKLIMEDVEYFRVGSRSVTVLRKNGDVYWWGKNQHINNPTPKLMLENAKYVSSGNTTMAAITNNNELYLWGNNTWRQCGVKDGGNIVIEATKVCDNVRMVWLEELMHNDNFQFGESWREVGKYSYENTFILTTDGEYKACGRYLETPVHTSYVETENADKNACTYSAEFLPITIVEDPFRE